MYVNEIPFIVDDNGVNTYSSMERYAIDLDNSQGKVLTYGLMIPGRIIMVVSNETTIFQCAGQGIIDELYRTYSFLLDAKPKLKFLLQNIGK